MQLFPLAPDAGLSPYYQILSAAEKVTEECRSDARIKDFFANIGVSLEQLLHLDNPTLRRNLILTSLQRCLGESQLHRQDPLIGMLRSEKSLVSSCGFPTDTASTIRAEAEREADPGNKQREERVADQGRSQLAGST